jgi:starch phosphorylase
VRRGIAPRAFVEADPELADVLALLESGHFSPREPDLFRPLVRSLVERDPYLVLADFRAYVECQARVARAWGDVAGWTRASILNVARMGRFSSDRSIRDYVREVWRTRAVTLAPVR